MGPFSASPTPGRALQVPLRTSSTGLRTTGLSGQPPRCEVDRPYDGLAQARCHSPRITARAVAATVRSTPLISRQGTREAPASCSRTSRVALLAGGDENRFRPFRQPRANSRSLISLRHSCAGTPLPATASAIHPAWRSASLVPSGSRPTMWRFSACGSCPHRMAAAVGLGRPLRTLTRPRARAVLRTAATGQVRSSRLALPIHQSLMPLRSATCSTTDVADTQPRSA